MEIYDCSRRDARRLWQQQYLGMWTRVITAKRAY
jgi:hypothetical protein